MMNFIAKFLVMVHTVLSVAGMGWAIMLFLHGRDFGWSTPYKDVLEYNADGTIKSAVLLASEYDKSLAAVTEAAKNRDRVYAEVKPAIDSIRDAEPYLPNNHFFYVSELNHLKNADDPIEVRRLEKSGTVLDRPILGKPVPEAKPLDMISKSYKQYEIDRKKRMAEIDVIETEIRKIVTDTKKITSELTGTDEANQYVQPGLYQLIDLEFRYQTEIKREREDIKPNWSKAIEQSRLLQIRRDDLQKTLDKLKAAQPMPPLPPKVDKKL